MIYNIGLIFVILLIIVSLDDLIWDLYYLLRRKRNKLNVHVIDEDELKNTVPRLLAVIVAAYNEEDVLEDVISNLIYSNHYPKSMYHVFLGIYPNDPGTIGVAEKLSKKFNNVHPILHVLDGPSSKADNINNVIKNIYAFEKENYIRFEGVIIHDSEDLVHPYEFLIENYLLNTHKAIQMPVFPLQEMPRISNIFKNMVSGTYADEFAENHYNLLVARNSIGSFVPSAGTGFVLSKDIIDEFPDYNVFPVGSLTEDYKLSLQLKQKGYDLHYALEYVYRLRYDGTSVREFISTRSIFPSTYMAAVRQKTRWIYGITMQSFKIKDVFNNEHLNLTSKYSLYKDWKAKFGNLLLGPGYLVFTYFILSLFFDIPTMYPKYTLSWYLMIFLSVMMIERQILRGIAVKNVYGRKSTIISILFPPLLPFRMLLGNIINFHATLRAWKIHIFKPQSNKLKKKPAWSKTDHEFLEESILRTFRRNLGDVLLNDGLISIEHLDIALKQSTENQEKLGLALRRLNMVSEENIVRSLCKVTQDIYINLTPDMVSTNKIDSFGKEFLIDNLIVPLIETKSGMVFVISEHGDKEILKDLISEKEINKENIVFVYSTKFNILQALTKSTNIEPILNILKSIEDYINEGVLTLNEGIIGLRYSSLNTPIEETLYSMGFLRIEDQLISSSG